MKKVIRDGEIRYLSQKPPEIIAELVKLYKLCVRDENFYRKLATFYNYHNLNGFRMFFMDMSAIKAVMVKKLFMFFLERKIIIGEYESSLFVDVYKNINDLDETVLPLETLKELEKDENNTIDSLGFLGRIEVGLRKEKYAQEIITNLSFATKERLYFDPITFDFLKYFIKKQDKIITLYDEILVSVDRKDLVRIDKKLEQRYRKTGRKRDDDEYDPLKIDIVKSKIQ